MKSWLLGIVLTSLAAGLARQLAPKGREQAMVRLVGGLLLTLALLIGVVWSIVTIFIGLQTVHDYTFGETVKSVILTVVFMIIVAVIGIIISIMWNSLYTFLTSVGKEMIQNVF